ncbi:MAG TPA: PA domain-containing protein [Thermoanaerobaculia bacterium]|nr:PA domain-containing protein [Thermoanaerobaculia bacterium]
MAAQRSLRAALVVVSAFLAGAGVAAGARITVVNGNEAGVGFNDPAAATPVGGNTGTTVGQQRLIAFQYAADLWAALLDSPVEIRVRATFEPLSCTATTAVLGAASPTQSVRDFPEAAFPSTWYAAALANRLAGEDLSPGTDDVTARFNSNLGSAGCFDGSGWYYGLDNQHGNQMDLVAVLLHELAHGLGFLTFVSDQGVEFLDHPDVFERSILDTTTYKHWTDMTTDERAASAVNTGHLTWDGQTVTAKAPSFLGGTPALTITVPASLAGNFEVGTADFGPELSEDAVSGPIVAALDAPDAAGPATTDACSALTNASALAGKIALVDRGTCFFVEKAARVQDAGAIGLIVVYNEAGAPPGMGGDDASIVIPSVIVTQEDGAAIRAALDGGVVGSLRVNPRRRAGTGAEGRVLLYAPNPDEPGSSISHWDTSAFPSLLMEPNLTGDLPHSVDLTLPLLYDIGWRPGTVPVPAARQAIQQAPGTGEPRVIAPRP